MSTIPEQIIHLQCSMTGCKRNVTGWNQWAEENLPTLWESCEGCPLEFCKRAHRQFTEHKGTVFADWHWDFLSALFDGEACNCVCGTNAILSCAEYVGLFPKYIQAMAGPQHVWIRARRKSDGEWWFLETTLRPNNPHWCLPQEQGRRKNIYGQGAWFSYTNPKLVVQEAFINQLLLSPRQSEMRSHLYRLMKTLAENDAGGDWIMDFRKLRIRQLTSTEHCYSEDQRRMIALMIHDISSSEWPPEAFMKSVLFVAKWLAWSFLCHEQPIKAPGSELERHRKDVSDLVREMDRRLKLGHWTMKCPPLKKLWTSMSRLRGIGFD